MDAEDYDSESDESPRLVPAECGFPAPAAVPYTGAGAVTGAADAVTVTVTDTAAVVTGVAAIGAAYDNINLKEGNDRLTALRNLLHGPSEAPPQLRRIQEDSSDDNDDQLLADLNDMAPKEKKAPKIRTESRK